MQKQNANNVLTVPDPFWWVYDDPRIEDLTNPIICVDNLDGANDEMQIPLQNQKVPGCVAIPAFRAGLNNAYTPITEAHTL
jgi:hypothetical protein